MLVNSERTLLLICFHWKKKVDISKHFRIFRTFEEFWFQKVDGSIILVRSKSRCLRQLFGYEYIDTFVFTILTINNVKRDKEYLSSTYVIFTCLQYFERVQFVPGPKYPPIKNWKPTGYNQTRFFELLYIFFQISLYFKITKKANFQRHLLFTLEFRIDVKICFICFTRQLLQCSVLKFLECKI